MEYKLPRPAWIVALLFLALVVWAAWRQDPDFWRSAGSLYQAALEADGRKDPGRALELARKAWVRAPENSGCGTFLGWLYLKAGQPDQALEIFRQVLARDQQAVQALTGQAQALERLGRHRQALEVLAAFLQAHPQELEVLRSAAELTARRPEDRELCISYLTRLYRLHPEPQVRRQLVEMFSAAGRFAEAITLQEEEAAQFPDEPGALHKLALLHYWQQDYQAAAAIYQRLLEQAADDEALRREAAQTADAAQKTDQALAHYLWLYSRHQGRKEYALALARLWSQKGNHAEAAGVLAPLMREKPEHELRRWYALELLLLRDFSRSLKAYEEAWEAGDSHKETIINLARLYAQARRFDRAAALWDEAARRQLVQGELSWEAALTYSYAQRHAEALEVVKPLYRQDPRNSRVLLFLGQAHFYQKHWDRAAHFFQAYLEQHPEDAEVRRQLAEVLSFQPNSTPAAIDQYGEVLKRQDHVALRLRRISLLMKTGRWEEAERELQASPLPEDPGLLRDQARLCLWAGDLEGALKRYDLCLKRRPDDREASLEKARTLIYLRRAPEALEVLKRLGTRHDEAANWGSTDRPLLVTYLEANLVRQNRPETDRWALLLYSSQFPERRRPAKNWQEASQWARGIKDEPGGLKEAKALGQVQPLTLEERTWVARALCHSGSPGGLRLAADLTLENLRENRYHHASLLILAYVLPRLPRFNDLNDVVRSLPGLREHGPEYVATLAFFNENLGRQGGKLDYLLHVLREFRSHRWPDQPGELMALADLAMELEQPEAAGEYYRRALKLKPKDQRLSELYLQCQMSRKDWSAALVSLEKQGNNPSALLETARLYLMRGQYEGVKAAVSRLPEGSPEQTRGLLLVAQVQRLEKNYPEALRTLGLLENRISREDRLMEKARVLEAQGDKAAVSLYDEISRSYPNTQAARLARARRARAQGNWAGAYQSYAQALQRAPQDIEVLNELEHIRQQMRPEIASRGFPSPRGERGPEEALRPWQLSRFDRDPRSRGRFFWWRPLLDRSSWRPGGTGLLSLPSALLWDLGLPVQPEMTGFTDSNQVYGGIFRLAGGAWIKKTLPVQVAAEYREYNQTDRRLLASIPAAGSVVNFFNSINSRVRRAEVSLGLGPLHVEDRLRISGEIIGRRYWRRVDSTAFQNAFPFPVRQGVTEKEHRNRLMGSLEVNAQVGARTEAALRYSRRDIFDQDSHLYPRLYQAVLNLESARFTGIHQLEGSFSHQFRPGLQWRGNLGGAWFSDQNRRVTLFQGLSWGAVRDRRMNLELTPHAYFASYSQRREAYFSPSEYVALGVGLDFDRQFFRLPTLILQGTAQMVSQRGQWGPALQGLAALELEWVQNFTTDFYIFYFREWIDNYRLLAAGASFRLRF